MEIIKHIKVKKHVVQLHSHDVGQFIYIKSGAMALKTEVGAWMVPEGRLAWLPPFCAHAVSSKSEITGWIILTDKKYHKFLPQNVCVLKVSNLMLALLERKVESENDSREFVKKIEELLYEEIKNAEAENFGLVLPVNENLLKITQEILINPNITNGLNVYAKKSGMSPRNFSRIFKQETGMSFDKWKKAAISQRAIELLAAGESVSNVSYRCGYESVSAFIYMFRKNMGASPYQFIQGHS